MLVGQLVSDEKVGHEKSLGCIRPLSRPKWRWRRSKGIQTLRQLAAQFGVHAKLVQTWKKQMSEEAATLFAGPAQASVLKQQQKQQAELYKQIARLKMELEWLKNKLPR